jgi:peptidylprolyl isomerase
MHKLINKTMKSLFLVLMISLAASCQDKYPDLKDGMYAEIVTNKGTMITTLLFEKTPVTVANFVSLAEGTNTSVDSVYKGKKFYNGLTFHRVMKNFMIQGGDPKGNGLGNPGYKFKDEFDSALVHDSIGVLSMANPGPSSNGSQFFITLKATPWLNNRHSVFGKLVKGEDILIAIGDVETVPKDKPKVDVIMQEVNIIRKGSAAKNFDANKIFEEHFAVEEKLAREKQAKLKEAIVTQKRTNEAYEKQAKALASGLKIHYITKGTGVKPKLGDYAMINYEGYFVDGSIFDSNVKEAEERQGKLNARKLKQNGYKPFPMKVSPDAQLITGFKEALANMQVGDKVYIYVPSHLAYGESGRGSIKPNTDLTFIMEMTGLKE